jgi:hypothetical protein
VKRAEKKAEQMKRRRGDLDTIVFLCVVAGLVMTCAPLAIWCFRFDTIPDAYFQYGFHFWGSELIATVAVYWLKAKKKKADVESTRETVEDAEDTGDAVG